MNITRSFIHRKRHIIGFIPLMLMLVTMFSPSLVQTGGATPDLIVEVRVSKLYLANDADDPLFGCNRGELDLVYDHYSDTKQVDIKDRCDGSEYDLSKSESPKQKFYVNFGDHIYVKLTEWDPLKTSVILKIKLTINEIYSGTVVGGSPMELAMGLPPGSDVTFGTNVYYVNSALSKRYYSGNLYYDAYNGFDIEISIVSAQSPYCPPIC